MDFKHPKSAAALVPQFAEILGKIRKQNLKQNVRDSVKKIWIQTRMRRMRRSEGEACFSPTLIGVTILGTTLLGDMERPDDSLIPTGWSEEAVWVDNLG